jgi:membrane protease YdiL (CAAX protease family)
MIGQLSFARFLFLGVNLILGGNSMEYLKRLKKYCIIILFTLGVIIFQDYLNDGVNYLTGRISPAFSKLDPDNAFMFLFVHHIIQSIIYFLLIFSALKIFKLRLSDFGFNLNLYNKSIKYTLILVGLWSIVQIVGGLLTIFYGTFVEFNFPLNTRNFTGYFLFEILLSGTSEELFFRALMITIITIILKKHTKTEKELHVLIIISTTIIFMVAHIGFNLMPLKVYYFNILQQLTAMIVSICYGIMFFKTKSLLGPILSHNLLNGLVTFVTLILSLMFK